MSDLRNKLIRLAHSKPDLRPDLLPLIRQAGESGEAGTHQDARVLAKTQKKVSHPVSDLGTELVGILGRYLVKTGQITDYMRGDVYEDIAWQMSLYAKKNPLKMVAAFQKATQGIQGDPR